MTLVLAQQSRGLTRDIVVQNTNDATITVTTNDKIRATIIRVGNTAKLTVSSDAPTANGSTFTKNSPSSGTNRLRLDATDLAAINPGTYTLEISMFDNADGAEWKTVNRQVIHIEDS